MRLSLLRTPSKADAVVEDGGINVSNFARARSRSVLGKTHDDKKPFKSMGRNRNRCVDAWSGSIVCHRTEAAQDRRGRTSLRSRIAADGEREGGRGRSAPTQGPSRRVGLFAGSRNGQDIGTLSASGEGEPAAPTKVWLMGAVPKRAGSGGRSAAHIEHTVPAIADRTPPRHKRATPLERLADRPAAGVAHPGSTMTVTIAMSGLDRGQFLALADKGAAAWIVRVSLPAGPARCVTLTPGQPWGRPLRGRIAEAACWPMATNRCRLATAMIAGRDTRRMGWRAPRRIVRGSRAPYQMPPTRPLAIGPRLR